MCVATAGPRYGKREPTLAGCSRRVERLRRGCREHLRDHARAVLDDFSGQCSCWAVLDRWAQVRGGSSTHPRAGGDLEVGGVQLATEDSLGDSVVDPLAAGGGAPWLRTAAPNGCTGSLNVVMISDSEKKPTTLTVSVPTLTTPCGTIAGMTARSPAVRRPRSSPTWASASPATTWRISSALSVCSASRLRGSISK